MSFTDDELQRAKDWILTADPIAIDLKLAALLHRLECAEKVIASIESESLDGAAYHQALEAWLQSKGNGII